MTLPRRERRLKAQREAMAKLRVLRLKDDLCPQCGSAKGPETLTCTNHAELDRVKARKGRAAA